MRNATRNGLRSSSAHNRERCKPHTARRTICSDPQRRVVAYPPRDLPVRPRSAAIALGQPPPGYAARRNGFRLYAALVLCVGVIAAGLAISPGAPLPGAAGTVVGMVGFLIASGMVLVGEIRTYRGLPKKG